MQEVLSISDKEITASYHMVVGGYLTCHLWDNGSSAVPLFQIGARLSQGRLWCFPLRNLPMQTLRLSPSARFLSCCIFMECTDWAMFYPFCTILHLKFLPYLWGLWRKSGGRCPLHPHKTLFLKSFIFCANMLSLPAFRRKFFFCLPSEKGSRTGARVRLRVHDVRRCGIHGFG